MTYLDANGIMWTADPGQGTPRVPDATANYRLVYYGSMGCAGDPILVNWPPNVAFTIGPAVPGSSVFATSPGPPHSVSVFSYYSANAGSTCVNGTCTPVAGCVATGGTIAGTTARQVGTVPTSLPAPLSIQ